MVVWLTMPRPSRRGSLPRCATIPASFAGAPHRSVPRVNAAILGLLAALTNSAQALSNKGLTERYPARQLIGVLYITNCLVLLPFAPFVTWHWSVEVWLLHG